MKFTIMNAVDASKHTLNEDINDCIIISINDPTGKINILYPNSHVKDILYLTFDDVEEFTDKDHFDIVLAGIILEFVDLYISQIDEIIVHCVGGVSRSAGVCAALKYIYTGDDIDIFSNPKYVPNRLCYTTILEKFYGGYNLEECDRKFNLNLELWKEANDI